MKKSHFAKSLRPFWIVALFISAGIWLIAPARAATYNVKKYGATGNGSTDDSQAIADAIKAASGASGNTVFFPAGNYRIGSASPKLQAKGMLLQGALNAVLNMTDENAQLVVNGSQTTVDNLTITNLGSNKNSGIVFNNAKNCLLEDCLFNNWTNGVRINGSSVTVKQNSFFMPKRQTGVLVQNVSSVSIVQNRFLATSSGYGYGIYSDGTKNSITANNNTFGELGYAIYWDGSSQPFNYGLPVGELSASNNTFQSCYYGLDCNGISNLTMNDNTISNSAYAIYALSNGTSKYAGNKIKSPAYNGFWVGQDHDRVQLKQNTITNVGSGYYGMYLVGAADASANTVSGTDGAYAGIYLEHYAFPVSNIDSNKISGFSYGIYSNASLSLNATNNTIDNIQYSGIYAYGDNFDKIVGNNLKDCGKSIGAYAVVYLNPASGIHGANDFTVTTNTYTAKQTPHLSYFVYVNADRRYTKIQGNTTNTMLPNYPQ